jgi:uncharacterized protein
VNGINPFGEVVVSDQVFSAMGRDKTPPPAPIITEGAFLTETSLTIKWEMDECSDLLGYNILKGYDFDLPMASLELVIPPNETSFTDNDANNVTFHYYIVEAIDTAGNKSQSLPFLVNFKDTIPPSAPTGLIGYCDSLGMVTLSWNRNPELDVYGYKVMFANDSLHEFSLLTGQAIPDTFYSHQIALNTLTENIYYRVFAVDLRFNISELSEILEVARHDTIPPLEPVFYNYKVYADSAVIFWYPSNSRDAIVQELYRSTDQQEWSLLRAMDNTVGKYADFDLEEGVVCFYKVIAYDKSNLSAECPYPMVVTPVTRFTIDAAIELSISELDGQALIQWKSDAKNAKITIYKSFGENKLQKFKTLDVEDSSYLDKMVYAGSSYQYAAILDFQNGKTSNFTDIVSFSLSEEKNDN